MNKMKQETLSRIHVLEDVISQKQEALLNSPPGILNVKSTPNGPMYYIKEHSPNETKRYIKKEDIHLTKALCQKEYDQQILRTAKKELKHLLALSKCYTKPVFEEVFGLLNPARKALVFPCAISDEEYIREWEKEEYITKGISGLNSELFTDRGEQVRSKTEILIANALNRYNIPYRYECSLCLENYGTIHPDFTILNIKERKEMYWEHLGMMDHPEYIKHALQRIAAYEQNDILPGKQLILTYETSECPISSKNIETKIKHYLLGV